VAILHWGWLPVVVGLVLVSGNPVSQRSRSHIIGVSAPRSCRRSARLPGQCSPRCFSAFLGRHPCAGVCPVLVGAPLTVICPSRNNVKISKRKQQEKKETYIWAQGAIPHEPSLPRSRVPTRCGTHFPSCHHSRIPV
jgi:hypothetical protein